jgi:hypothetical protein
VTTAVHQQQVDLSLVISPEVPSYTTGNVWRFNPAYISYSLSFTPLAEEIGANQPIKLPNSGCSGTCTTTVHAPALALDSCTSKIHLQNFSEPLTGHVQEVAVSIPPPENRIILKVAGIPIEGRREKIQVDTVVARPIADRSCSAHVNSTTCYYVSAVGEYSVLVKDDIISTVGPPRILMEANNTAINNATIARYHLTTVSEEYVDTTLSGIVYLMTMQYLAVTYLIQWPGTPSPSLLYWENSWFSWNSLKRPQTGCIPHVRDPRDIVLAWLNEVMFRTGVHYGQTYDTEKLALLLDPGLVANQTVIANQTAPLEVYQVKYEWFAAAAAVEMFASMVVLMTLWGYWRLGRSASLSPIETAKVRLACESQCSQLPQQEGSC